MVSEYQGFLFPAVPAISRRFPVACGAGVGFVRSRRRAPRPRPAAFDIDSNVPGLIVMGRRDQERDRPHARRQLSQNLNIKIHTYDWLVDKAQERVMALDKSRDAGAG
jgi:hypothetical protein